MAIKNKIIIKSRTKVLKRTIMDLFEGTYSNNSDMFSYEYTNIMQTIEKGIDLEYLKKISILGLHDDKIINRLIFNIDWNKHKLFCESSNQTFEVMNGSSIAEEIGKILPILSEFIVKLINSSRINNFVVYYSYRDGINEKMADYQLGLSNINDKTQKSLYEFEKDDFAVEIRPEKLSELVIRFDTKR